MNDQGLPGIAALRPAESDRPHVLFVDLNNFSTFPTLAIGLLVSSLRAAGHSVEVVTPLSHGVVAAERERPETIIDHWARLIHHADLPGTGRLLDFARSARASWRGRMDPAIMPELERALARGPAILLLSAYLEHYEIVRRLCSMAADFGVPVLLGGPVFNVEPIADY